MNIHNVLKQGDNNMRKRNKTKRLKKPFCIHGHEIAVVGRDKWGSCNQCVKIKTHIDPSKDSRFHQFCPKGHDTFIFGRNSGWCKECKKKKIEKYINKKIKKSLK